MTTSMLTDYGFHPFFEAYCDLSEGLIPARVTEQHRERYMVVTEHGEAAARLTGLFRHQLEAQEDYPVTGDFVLLAWNPQGDSQIHKLMPRRTKFSRPDYQHYSKGGAPLEQVVAANFDVVCILSALNADFSPRRVERYLTAAWQSGAVPVVVLTKTDLCPDITSPVREIEAVSPGVDIFPISNVTGEGLPELRARFKPGQTAVFLGMSGIGKSSLVNALAGETLMDIGGIRESDARGRHTTTHRELLRLPDGLLVIDTPGMRELGLWDADEGLDDAFADIIALARNCRFADCAHRAEPGCAVRAAVSDGRLPEQRLKSFLGLAGEVSFFDDKTAYLRQKQQKHKEISKQYRQTTQSKLLGKPGAFKG